MTITKLKETNGDQVRKLLEANGVMGIKAIGKRFDICCPACEKTEAFIDYQGDHRWIKCNRENNCGYITALWDFIAEKQGIDGTNNQKMLEYINYTIGQEFTTHAQDINPACLVVVDSTNEDLEFLTHCNQIFKNAFKQDTPEVKFAWDYLKNRGYDDEHINAFNLGYLPNSSKLIDTLNASPYCYSKSEANTLVQKYFEGIFSWNERLNQQEEYRNRIAFTWYDKVNNVAGFSFRKPTNQNTPMKYVFNKEAPKSTMLFNIDNWKLNKEKKLVIVEGTFDALAASYLSTEEAREQYHFVAMGGSSLTQGQVELLKSHNVTEAILLIDNDKAGEKYQSSIQKLTQYGINASIARIPKEAKAKDIDELLCKHADNKEINIMTILKNAKVECKKENNMKPEEQQVLTDSEISKQNERGIKLQEQLKDNIPIDLHLLKRSVHCQSKNDLYKAINVDISAINYKKETYDQAQQYNDLLAVNYEDDEAYTNDQYVQDLCNSPQGIKLGFNKIDRHIIIQPSTINFVAGRPSHGKTTAMINMMRNMIRANPKEAFLFYSYEETHVDIMTKIILSSTSKLDKELLQIKNGETSDSYFATAKEYLKAYAKGESNDSQNMTDIQLAYKEVKTWLEDGRLQIMTRKPNVESLTGAIIERVQKIENKEKDESGKMVVKGKKVAVIFIDYVQKLNTEGEKANRQQELHKVCKDLLNTSSDKRVEAAIILGAQANREVKSLETFQMENMREAGDIEQDANIVIGVWDNEAAELNNLNEKLSDIKIQIKNLDLGYNPKNGYTMDKLLEIQLKINMRIQQLDKRASKTITFKILKNRNGKNNVVHTVTSYPERFCLVEEIEWPEEDISDKSTNMEDHFD